MNGRYGTVECINIIRHSFYKKIIYKHIHKESNILIVGGGNGDSLLDYYNSSSSITFTDIDQDAIEFVKKKYSDLNISLLCCSAYELPFKNESFDVIVSTLNGSYLNSKALNEFYRIMKRGSELILSETTTQYIDYLREMDRYDGTYILASDMETKKLHPYVYTKAELEKICASSGLKTMHFEILRPNSLIPDNKLSSVIHGFSSYLGCKTSDVPLLYYAFLQKEIK